MIRSVAGIIYLKNKYLFQIRDKKPNIWFPGFNGFFGGLIDKNGSLTRDPNEYFKGGAILPAGGYKGYGLALIGELIAEAVIGEVSGDANWLIIFLNTKLYQEKNNLMVKAEEILLLLDLESCPIRIGPF